MPVRRSWRTDPRLHEIAAVAVLLSVAIALRAVLLFRVPVFLEGDSQSYLLPAWDLVFGNSFSPELRRAPLYPMFIAGSFVLAGQQIEALAALQHLLGVVTTLLTYVLARRWLTPLPSLLAGLLIAISGPLLIYE